MSASGVSPFHLRFARLTQLSGTCRCPLLGVWFVLLFVSPCLGLFCKCQKCFDKFLQLYSSNASMLARLRDKKKLSKTCLVEIWPACRRHGSLWGEAISKGLGACLML